MAFSVFDHLTLSPGKLESLGSHEANSGVLY